MTDTNKYTEDIAQEGANRPLPLLKLDPDEFREDMAEFGMTKEQEDEYLQTLWNILAIFVDLGWGVETVQNFLPELFGKDGQDSGNLLEAKDSKSHFNNAVQHDEPARKGKGL